MIPLNQPPDIQDKKLHQWLFLLWKNIVASDPGTSQSILATRAFTPRPIPFYQSLNAPDSQNILAGQIFGK